MFAATHSELPVKCDPRDCLPIKISKRAVCLFHPGLLQVVIRSRLTAQQFRTISTELGIQDMPYRCEC